MKRLLALLCVLSSPGWAQYAHRSNPGVIGYAQPTITANGQCATLQAGGTNTAMFAVTGTWTGTISFQGTNDGGVTTVALQAYPVTTSTGALGAVINSTTGNGVWVADVFGMVQVQACATAAWTGTASLRIDADPADVVQQVTGVGGAAIPVTGSLSVSGTADVVSAGAPTTFNANSICTGSLLLAGEQSASFELNPGTLAATFTPQCSGEASGSTNFTNGQFKDATGAATNTLVVTNPNALTNLQIICPASRRAQVCTTAYTSGSATGLANAVFAQGGAAAGSGGGTVTQGSANTAANAWPVVETVSGSAIDPRSIRALTSSDTVTTAPPSNASANVSQINGVTPLMGNGVTGTGSPRVTIASDNTPFSVNSTAVGTTTVAGNKTNNAATPGATNIGAMPCIANASAPTWTEGDLVFCSVDLAGNLRTSGGGGGGGLVTVGDGTTSPVSVKAASTLPAATDKAFVVTLRDTPPGVTAVKGSGTAGSPGTDLYSVQGVTGMTPLFVKTTGTDTVAAVAPDNFAIAALLNSACTSTTACTSAQSIQWPATGSQSAEVTITAISSPTGISVACDKSYDGGATYVLASCYFWNGTSRKTALANADLIAGTQWAIYWTGAPSHIRVRTSVFSSGSYTVAGRSVTAPGLPFPVEAKPPTQATVTLTASTSETTLLSSGGTGIFLDLTYAKCSNTSSTASVISLRDATAGTVRDTFVCPAAIGPCEGNVYRTPFAQTTAANNWTIQAGTSASSIICTAQAVQR